MRLATLLLLLVVACSPCRNYEGEGGECARRGRPGTTEPQAWWEGQFRGENEYLLVELTLYNSPACSLHVDEYETGRTGDSVGGTCYYTLYSNRVLVRVDMRIVPENVRRTLDYTFVWQGDDLQLGGLLLERQGG